MICMYRLIFFFSFLSFFLSMHVFAKENLINKSILCSDLLWGFEFYSSKKVKVINTDVNNKSYIRDYHYEINPKLPYINIYLINNEIKELIYSVHLETLRVDIWTMTSGGNTTRELIPRGFCKIKNISNIYKHINKLKKNN